MENEIGPDLRHRHRERSEAIQTFGRFSPRNDGVNPAERTGAIV